MVTRLGIYKTKSGNRAIVAQIKSEGKNSWIVRGAIEAYGVLYIIHWNYLGRCVSGQSKFDLVTDGGNQ
jgi:hypothetical protein